MCYINIIKLLILTDSGFRDYNFIGNVSFGIRDGNEFVPRTFDTQNSGRIRGSFEKSREIKRQTFNYFAFHSKMFNQQKLNILPCRMTYCAFHHGSQLGVMRSANRNYKLQRVHFRSEKNPFFFAPTTKFTIVRAKCYLWSSENCSHLIFRRLR